MRTSDADLIHRIADEAEIRNIVGRLAHLADHGDIEEYISLFLPDARWEMPGAPRQGHDDIRAGSLERRNSGMTGPGSNTRHSITTLTVQTDGSDTATADSYWLFYGDTLTSPTIRLMGYYHDSFQRTKAGWKLAQREITFG